MTTIASRLQVVRQRINAAATAAGRSPGEVRLIAVSKTFPAEAIFEAVRAGQTAFGENYVQEAVGKISAVQALLDAVSACEGRAFNHIPIGREGPGHRPEAGYLDKKGVSLPKMGTAPKPQDPHDGPASEASDNSRRDLRHSYGVASPQVGPLLCAPDGRVAMQGANDSESSGDACHSSAVASPQAGPLLCAPDGRVAMQGADGSQPQGDARHSSGVASPQSGPLLFPPEWHFIGPIQSNKTRVIAENFSWVHSVDRLKIAQRLSDARPVGLAPLNICIQVNVSGEASKSGVSPGDVLPLALEVAALPRLRLRGLMAIPEPTEDRALQRRRFAALRELRNRIVGHGLDLDTLSMGMSDDLEAAIAEGATIVRVGRAIFGERAARAPA